MLVFRMSNCIVDDANWKAALLACSTVGSVVREIVIQRCQLQSSYLSDLAVVIEKMGSLMSLKLEYCTWEGARERVGEYKEGMKQLMGAAVTIEYLSLRGNKLGDSFLTELLSPSLSSCLSIKALNISDNSITESSLSSILSILRFNTSLEWINASNNNISILPSDSLSSLLLSSLITTDDETNNKLLLGKITDRNKAIKELNKKRKKGGLAELAELAPKAACVIKIGTENRVINQSLSILDVSNNPLDLSLFSSSIIKLRDNYTAAPEAVIKACQIDSSITTTITANTTTISSINTNARLLVLVRGGGIDMNSVDLSIHPAVEIKV